MENRVQYPDNVQQKTFLLIMQPDLMAPSGMNVLTDPVTGLPPLCDAQNLPKIEDAFKKFTIGERQVYETSEFFVVVGKPKAC